MKTLHKVTTKYHKIEVVEEDGLRGLISGRGISQEQSAIKLSDLRFHVFDYSLTAMYSLGFIPYAPEVLIVGLGGGVVPREIAHYSPLTAIDVIEIDKEIIRVAKDYFFIEESETLKIHKGDAFFVIPEMATANRKYDIVFLDAFLANYIPFPLMSEEYFKSVASVLKDDSVVAVNCCNIHPSFLSHINTMVQAFGDQVYRMDGKRNTAATMLFFVRGNKLPGMLGLSPDYYPPLIPKPQPIGNRIKNSKVFRLKDV
jgi:spermidine synthase